MSSCGDPAADLSAGWPAPRGSSPGPGVRLSHFLFSVDSHRCVCLFGGCEARWLHGPSIPQRYGGQVSPLQFCSSETMSCVGLVSSRASGPKRPPTMYSSNSDYLMSKTAIGRSLNCYFDGE